MSDRRVLRLFRQWLCAGVLAEGVLAEGVLAEGVLAEGASCETATRTPQGGVASPLLANIYRRVFDRAWVARGTTKGQAEHAQRRPAATLGELGLSRHRDKSTEERLVAHETAHQVGLTSNVTIMHGTIERPEHLARHLLATRDLQRRTGGFTEFVPLPFVHMAAPLYLTRRSRRGPTFREVLLMHAVGRIAYHGLIDNIQASWVKVGVDGVRQLLQAGVNDLGGTLMEENISRAAGASHGQGLDPADFEALVAPLARPLRQRATLHQRVT